MSQAKDGDKIRVHYAGSLEDGTEFDSSYKRGEPLEIVLGQGMLIKGFEDAVKGLSVGEKVKATISPEEGYGPYHEEHTFEVDRNQIPPEINPEVGMMLQVNTDQGVTNVTIKSVSDEKVVLDGNHPLAGQTMIFEIELLEIMA
ncbi:MULTISPECIES: FKBP-type peptidyl-prolyl cis-trans isomerase [Maridesulfovibrio]|uniref:Peptidyl-prolyl cis-trans isomerase n=1 Tax=Maridesulfovibrio salexigens (strain ATCC 14822 / DSM 2638 / NCIMB 8403 / VKM B-1763) TaxID=526222 RepID=C6BUZ4_MARSD|nr:MULTISPECIES: peptidylprolyl isomerase [Maridesulfovibrio]ACS78131.1 peptidylprolyl isomerase FKBP-type [Maridesulfovibrio salexigens DSM 2638]